MKIKADAPVGASVGETGIENLQLMAETEAERFYLLDLIRGVMEDFGQATVTQAESIDGGRVSDEELKEVNEELNGIQTKRPSNGRLN